MIIKFFSERSLKALKTVKISNTFDVEAQLLHKRIFVVILICRILNRDKEVLVKLVLFIINDLEVSRFLIL